MVGLDMVRAAAAERAEQERLRAAADATSRAEREAKAKAEREAEERAERGRLEERVGVALVRLRFEEHSPELERELQDALAAVGIVGPAAVVDAIDKGERDLFVLMSRAARGAFGEWSEQVRIVTKVRQQVDRMAKGFVKFDDELRFHAHDDNVSRKPELLDAVSGWFAARAGRSLELRPAVAAALGLTVHGHRAPTAVGEPVQTANPFEAWLPPPIEWTAGVFSAAAWVDGLTTNQRASLLAELLGDDAFVRQLAGDGDRDVFDTAYEIANEYVEDRRTSDEYPSLYRPPVRGTVIGVAFAPPVPEVPRELLKELSVSTAAERQGVLDRLLSRPLVFDPRNKVDPSSLVFNDCGPTVEAELPASVVRDIDGLSENGRCHLVSQLLAAGVRPSLAVYREWVSAGAVEVLEWREGLLPPLPAEKPFARDPIPERPAPKPESWIVVERYFAENVPAMWSGSGFARQG